MSNVWRRLCEFFGLLFGQEVVIHYTADSGNIILTHTYYFRHSKLQDVDKLLSCTMGAKAIDDEPYTYRIMYRFERLTFQKLLSLHPITFYAPTLETRF